jgi:hypothetical protein
MNGLRKDDSCSMEHAIAKDLACFRNPVRKNNALSTSMACMAPKTPDLSDAPVMAPLKAENRGRGHGLLPYLHTELTLNLKLPKADQPAVGGA